MFRFSTAGFVMCILLCLVSAQSAARENAHVEPAGEPDSVVPYRWAIMRRDIPISEKRDAESLPNVDINQCDISSGYILVNRWRVDDGDERTKARIDHFVTQDVTVSPNKGAGGKCLRTGPIHVWVDLDEDGMLVRSYQTWEDDGQTQVRPVSQTLQPLVDALFLGAEAEPVSDHSIRIYAQNCDLYEDKGHRRYFTRDALLVKSFYRNTEIHIANKDEKRIIVEDQVICWAPEMREEDS